VLQLQNFTKRTFSALCTAFGTDFDLNYEPNNDVYFPDERKRVSEQAVRLDCRRDPCWIAPVVPTFPHQLCPGMLLSQCYDGRRRLELGTRTAHASWSGYAEVATIMGTRTSTTLSVHSVRERHDALVPGNGQTCMCVVPPSYVPFDSGCSWAGGCSSVNSSPATSFTKREEGGIRTSELARLSVFVSSAVKAGQVGERPTQHQPKRPQIVLCQCFSSGFP